MTRIELIERIVLFQEGIDLPEDSEWADFFTTLEQHPDLKEAFESDQLMSARESELLRATVVPSQLLEQILALEAENAPADTKIISFPAIIRTALAAAAVFALGFSVYFFTQANESNPAEPSATPIEFAQAIDMAALKEEIIRFEQAPQFQFRNSDLAALKNFLRHQGTTDPDALLIPAGLHGLPTTGCNVIDVQGHAVSMICFQIDSSNRVHLFAVEKNALREAPPVSNPQFETVHRWPAASWSDDRHSYFMLTREASPDRGAGTLRALLINN
jgi:hypothetical protein